MGRVFNKEIVENNKLKEKLDLAEEKLEQNELIMAEIIEKQENEIKNLKEEQEKNKLELQLVVAEILEGVI